MRCRSLLGSGGVVAAVVVATAVAAPAPALAAPEFAPADEATVHPGVMTYTDGAQCTANFVFTSGDDVFIGQAAHCAGTGTATETDGCDAGSLPLGTEVEIEGASRPGVLAYSSWLAMQANGETDENACAYNDFALVRIDPADVAAVNPTVPFFGGPVGLDDDGTTVGERVYSYGNSSLRLGLEPLSPKAGTSVGTAGDGWTHDIYTVSPGIPGDSGSAVLSSTGEALGTLSTVQLAPLAGSNGVSDLSRELAYANEHGGLGTLTLELGTEPFDPIL
ncbi:serine protease [Pseudonocardia nigra]|uniref:serine protease n=1 Tax=Pseudonocardia nigra TaxID=1921578 RepID=UPI001FE4E513|nr:serine protease [Pseudonocardia nigra]